MSIPNSEHYDDDVRYADPAIRRRDTETVGAGASMAEAMESLTVAEVGAIERHFGGEFGGEGITGTSLTVGVVWALERRRLLGQANRPNWEDFDAWTLKQLNEYFQPEEVEIDPSEPETPAGKGD